MTYPQHLLKIIASLRQLPGVGEKTAERYAFQMLRWSKEKINALSLSITELPQKLTHCSVCGCLIDPGPCSFCDLSVRQTDKLAVVASDKDVFALDGTGHFRGLYHVLEGVLSPLEGKGPEVLRLEILRKRIEEHGIREVILALDSTLDGDATALYIKRHLDLPEVQISRLAFGIPIGSPLDYIDEGTLTRAFSGRTSV